MNKTVRIHLETAILIGSQRYSKVLLGEARPEADLTYGKGAFRTFLISGYIVSYKYHALMGPTVYNLAESNILAVNEYTVPENQYAERNLHEFLARQLFAVPEDKNLTPQQYDDAKKISLGLGYGMCDSDLAHLLKRPVDQAAALLDRYLSFLGVNQARATQAPKARAKNSWRPGPWGSAEPVTRRCANVSRQGHKAHRYQEPGGSPNFKCPGNPVTDYPVKQCDKQFEHQGHNYRTPTVNTTCLGRDR